LFVRCPRSGVDTSLTRRYHRLLIAPLDPPLDRAPVFAKADTELVVGEQRLPLSTSTVAVLFVLRRGTGSAFSEKNSFGAASPPTSSTSGRLRPIHYRAASAAVGGKATFAPTRAEK
jgi:hypothetical protein